MHPGPEGIYFALARPALLRFGGDRLRFLDQPLESHCGTQERGRRPVGGAESLRRTGTLTHQQFLNSSPGFKRWCYELTGEKTRQMSAGLSFPGVVF